jgi:signal transduction histidine kinase
MVASRAFDERQGHACGWLTEVHVPRPRGTNKDVHICTHYHSLLMVQRNLHDQVGSSLAGMTMTIDVARRSLARHNPTEADRVLGDLRADVTALLSHVRHLLNNCGPGPEGGTVTVALRSMISGMSRAVTDRMAITLDIDARLGTVPDDIAWAGFWIVREAMTNVLKHSDARHCAVTLCVRNDELHVRIQDDGVGMRPTRRTDSTNGVGIANMTTRATDQGGWCSIEPAQPSGVAVTARFPLLESARHREVR